MEVEALKQELRKESAEYFKNREHARSKVPTRLRALIKRAHKDAEMSFSEIAELSDFSPTTISKINQEQLAAPVKKSKVKKRAKAPAASVGLVPGMLMTEIQYNDGPTAKVIGSPDDIHRLLVQLRDLN